MVRVTLTPDAAAELDRVPLTIRARMIRIFERLERWPDVSGAKPLRGDLAGVYRIRTGDYRVLFRVGQDALVVERVGHRAGFYGD
jgi:mRNA interferase RelE/StbE